MLWTLVQQFVVTKISISAIAGGSEIAGVDGAPMGGSEFTREVSILSRTAGFSENGGWL